MIKLNLAVILGLVVVVTILTCIVLCCFKKKFCKRNSSPKPNNFDRQENKQDPNKPPY